MALAQVESDQGTVNVGQEWTATATFTDANSTVADPTTVTFWVKDPAGTVTSYVYGTDAEATKSSTGVYVLTIELATAGKYRAGVTGDGAVDAAAQWRFSVNSYPGP